MKHLSYPIRSKYFERAGNEHVKVSLCSLQGRRMNMEDSYIIRLNLPNHQDCYLFGIFDGHNGKGASQYLANNIADELNKLQNLDDPKMIQNCIMKMDREFLKTEISDTGSCMVFAIIKPLIKDQSKKTDINKNVNRTSDEAISDVAGYRISLFWAGDSRCLWLSPDTSKGMTKDHVPTNNKEKERIEKAEGLVVSGRVDARLAVSRAFGDSSLKNNTTKSLEKQKVVALCDYQTFTANPGDWLFLYCDGLSEKWTNEEITEKLKHYVSTYQDSAHSLGYMFDEILNDGSADNMTACLIQLQNGLDHATDLKAKTFLPGPLFIMRNDPDFVRAYMDNAEMFGHFDTPRLRLAAYQEDMNFLKRFRRNDPDFPRIINEIQDAIRQLQLTLGNEDIDQDTDESLLKQRGDKNKTNMDTTSTTKATDTTDTTDTNNKNVSSTNTGDITSGNKKRRITLDQWVYVYDNTL